MIDFIYGNAGCGKSTAVYQRIIERLRGGNEVLLIVPEQQLVDTEGRLSRLAADEGVPSVGLSVQSFRRLPNTVFRQYGGLRYNYITKGARSLIMWRALSAVGPDLRRYGALTLADRDSLSMLVSAASALKEAGIEPDDFSAAAPLLEEGSGLRDKVSDFALIYGAYEAMLSADFDDPEEDLPRLCRLAEEKKWFSGKEIFIDSFYSFTGQELRLIGIIFRQAAQVTVTVGALPGDERIFCRAVRKTEQRLMGIIRENGLGAKLGERLILRTPHRYRSPAVEKLASSLWSFGEKGTQDDLPDGLYIDRCADRSSECRRAAAEISRSVMEDGSRYRDHIIVLRDAESSRGIIEAALREYDIPFFFSGRADVSSKPLIRLVFSLLSLVGGGWRGDDLIAVLKTGLTGADPDAVDLFEKYVECWHLRGKNSFCEDRWTMNPDGFSEHLTDEGAAILEEVNGVREAVVPLISAFAESGGESVKTVCTALYELLCAFGVPETLEKTGEEEPIQLWNALCTALDQLVKILPDEKVTFDRFSALLSAVLSDADIGRIPQSADSVTVCSAPMLRADCCAHVHLLGVNEGVFPGNVRDDGFFSDADIRRLSEVGITLDSDAEGRSADEYFRLWRAVCCAEDTVGFSYVTGTSDGKEAVPSIAVRRVEELFPAIRERTEADADAELMVRSEKSAFRFIASRRTAGAADAGSADTGAAEKRAVAAALRKRKGYSEKLEALSLPLTGSADVISAETARKPEMSQARLNTFRLCPFSYHCKYTLELSEEAEASFDGADTGNLVHKLLERFAKGVVENGGFGREIPEEEIAASVDEILGEYVAGICGRMPRIPKRLEATFGRLRKICCLLCRELSEEFRNSSGGFAPAFFELPVGMPGRDGESVPSYRIGLPDGGTVNVRGFIDRVDTYKKDGDVYVRVVDYKTGTQDFSLDDVRSGLNMQMLLYLFALQNCRDENTLRRFGVGEGGKILPAGVLYFSAKPPSVNVPSELAAEKVDPAASISRRGLLIDDLDILRAMEPELGGRYIPVELTQKKELTAASRKKVMSLEQFARLRREIEEKTAELVADLSSGNAGAKPLRTTTKDACLYCGMRPICRVCAGQDDGENEETGESGEAPNK